MASQSHRTAWGETYFTASADTSEELLRTLLEMNVQDALCAASTVYGDRKPVGFRVVVQVKVEEAEATDGVE